MVLIHSLVGLPTVEAGRQQGSRETALDQALAMLGLNYGAVSGLLGNHGKVISLHWAQPPDLKINDTGRLKSTLRSR